MAANSGKINVVIELLKDFCTTINDIDEMIANLKFKVPYTSPAFLVAVGLPGKADTVLSRIKTKISALKENNSGIYDLDNNKNLLGKIRDFQTDVHNIKLELQTPDSLLSDKIQIFQTQLQKIESQLKQPFAFKRMIFGQEQDSQGTTTSSPNNSVSVPPTPLHFFSSVVQQTKILIIGDNSVGKSCLVTRLFDKKYTGVYMGKAYMAGIQEKSINLNSSTVPVQINIVDPEIKQYMEWAVPQGKITAPAYSSFLYFAPQAIILAFAVTKSKSFDNLQRWLKEIETYYTKESPKIILAATQCDILEIDWEIRKEEINSFAIKHSMKVFFTSAKKGMSVTELFTETVRPAIEERDQNQKSHGPYLGAS